MLFRLKKMKVQFDSVQKTEHQTTAINYFLSDEQNSILMNDLIDKEIILNFTGNIFCVACQKLTTKSFGQGFCYPCFLKSPENSECIIRPELCKGHEGIGRDVLWELENHVQNHIVYLALTSDVKVGITRKSNLFNRWIDQGAWKTIILAETPNRYLSGKIEVSLKEHMLDKTNWQKMLKNEKNNEIDLLLKKQEIKALLSNDLQSFISSEDEIHEFVYPVKNYPEKVNSESFDKTPQVKGKLIGIRGQYLIFDGGRVINIRKFSGYEVELNFAELQNDSEPKGQMSLF